MRISILAVALCALCCEAEHPKCERELSKEEAIAIAEQFVADNGFTLAQPVEDRIVLDGMERGVALRDVLARRKGILTERAAGSAYVHRGRWQVFFEYAEPVRYLDRAVVFEVIVDGCTGETVFRHAPSEIDLKSLGSNETPCARITRANTSFRTSGNEEVALVVCQTSVDENRLLFQRVDV